MLEDKSKNVESTGRMSEEDAKRYDQWYDTFAGAVEHWVDWELLKGHLPKNRAAKILDAAGGTGRITLPLAKLGYSVTLCDISPAMLSVARQKLLRERSLDKVEILECDICNLQFADETFDFVLCWNGVIENPKELVRVTKKGGKVSVFLANRCRGAIDLFPEDPGSAFALINSRSDYVYDDKEKRMAASLEQARELFEKEGIKGIEIYAVCGMLEFLSIPEEVLESRNWDEKFFRQVTEMLLKLSKEPSVKGMSRHLVLYGERI